MTTGYSGKPLAEKLGVKRGDRVLVRNAPDGYPAALGMTGVVMAGPRARELDVIVWFAESAAKPLRQRAAASDAAEVDHDIGDDLRSEAAARVDEQRRRREDEDGFVGPRHHVGVARACDGTEDQHERDRNRSCGR